MPELHPPRRLALERGTAMQCSRALNIKLGFVHAGRLDQRREEAIG
ncbi:MAG TPA: hypothetical protein VF178_15520 [Gemmatimonadaceae bacterium]